ncbi:MAG: orotate phosphoribosyltransferase [Alphaproteobacteria bacterium]|nr:MAG: orotate phosphoribosyltransferase [Alphaproteobacteria bacterium]
MDREEVLNHFREAGALLEGHFLLSSGLHSAVYLQCAKVLQNPERATLLCVALAEQVRKEIPGEVELVVAPAMGGVVVGYEMARQLGIDGLFTERVRGEVILRRGFEIPKGTKVLMVEDVVTTGLSSKECIECIRAAGGDVIGGASLVNRSGGRADIGVPLVSLLTLDVAAYTEADLPEELKAIPAVKPGSRNLKK